MEMTVEEKKQQTAKFVKWGLIGLSCAVLAPLAWMAVTGIAGLMIAGGLALIGVNLAPVVALKAANMKYRALDAERVDHVEKVATAAAVNPIETLINQSLDKRQASDQFRGSITMFRTEVKNFADQISGFAKEYPDDVARFQTQLDAMNKLLKFREDRYKQLQVELDNFDAAIKRAQAMWKMSQAAQKMNKLAGVELGDPFEKIKADSAINSVMTSMNKAFAEMETALLDNKEVQKAQSQQFIENSPQPVLVPTVTSAQSTPVPQTAGV
jgi:septal ring factor EnvC (AmiA/AmiB activator)